MPLSGPATTNQLARAGAGVFRREWRVSIGPPRAYVTAGLITQGSPASLPVPTTTTWAIDGASVAIPVVSTIGYPTAGVLCVRSPLGVGWWSYETTGLTTFWNVVFLRGRATHAAGASVSVWSDISEYVTEPPIIEEREEAGETHVIYDWSAELTGVGYNSHLMYPDASVLIEERLTPHGTLGTWTPWMVAALGYVREWRSEGDANGVRAWSATVQSVATYVTSHPVAARRYGRQNLAESASVTASPPLGSPALERAEFWGGLGTTVASNVVDGLPDSRYIALFAPTRTPEPTGASGSQLLIDEVMVAGPPGAPPSLQYFVVRMPPNSPVAAVTLGGDNGGWIVTNELTTYEPSYVPAWPWEAVWGFVPLPNITLTREQPRAVFCRDRAVIEAYFGAADGVPIYEWPSLPMWEGNNRVAAGSLPALLFALGTTSGTLHLRRYFPDLDAYIEDMAVWGPNLPAYTTNDAPGWWESSGAALGPIGTSLRRWPTCHDSNSKTDWGIEHTPMPGDARSDGDTVHISLDLGEFSVALDGALTAGQTTIPVDSATPLAEAGTIQINLEQIWYTSRTDTELRGCTRGANGTTAAAHADGAAIYAVDADGAHRQYTVEALEVVRQRVLGADGTPVVPTIMSVWGSVETSPAYPGTLHWQLDWIGSTWLAGYTNAGGATTVTIPLPAPRRMRHIMLHIGAMSDGGRAKVNEIRVWKREAGGGTVAGTPGAGMVLRSLLEEVVSSDEITIAPGAFLGSSPARVIAAGELGGTLAELLGELVASLRYTRDGRIEIGRHPAHPTAPRPPIIATLSAAHVVSPHAATHPSPLGLGQLIVEVNDPATDELFIGKFPPGRAAPGASKRVGPLRVQVGGTAGASQLAQMLFLLEPSTSHSFEVETFGPAEWLSVGDRVFLVTMDDGAAPGRLYDCRVTSVTHGGPGGREALTLVEWRWP